MSFPIAPTEGDKYKEHRYLSGLRKKINGIVESGDGYVKLIDGTYFQ